MTVAAEWLIGDAIRLVIEAHGTQRYGDRPYVDHLREVVFVLRRFGYTDPDLETAAWLHDILEDTSTTYEELYDRFGSHVAELVWRVTNESPDPAATWRKMATVEDATVLKLADRIANVEASIHDCALAKTHSSFGNDVLAPCRYLEQYSRQQPRFRAAVRVEGQADEMWELLDSLLAA